MTRQTISTGSSANDGTGDTLRSAGTKINANFTELYTLLGGSANTLTSQVTLGSDAVIFEGSTPDGNETSLKVTDPTVDRTITLPNATGTISLIDNTETLTNKTLTIGENKYIYVKRSNDIHLYVRYYQEGSLVTKYILLNKLRPFNLGFKQVNM